MSFVPAAVAAAVVKERECKAKALQLLSGAPVSAYWLSFLLGDFLLYLVTFTLLMLVFAAFGVAEFTSGRDGAATALLLLLYGPASSAMTYLASFLFTSHSSAQSAIMILNFVTGIVLLIISTVMVREECSAAPIAAFHVRSLPQWQSASLPLPAALVLFSARRTPSRTPRTSTRASAPCTASSRDSASPTASARSPLAGAAPRGTRSPGAHAAAHPRPAALPAQPSSPLCLAAAHHPGASAAEYTTPVRLQSPQG